MHCRAGWNREFIDVNLTRSWREGELRKHRATLLFERERSLLPATQPLLERRRRKDEAAARMRELTLEATELKMTYDRLRMRIENLRRGREEGGPVEEESERAERRQFIAACPAADCRGFLSTAYKCGTCTTQYCAHCREVKITGEVHTCNPELVATIAAIVKESRPCPNCGTAISKVDGCDQMFCTNCNTAFSWKTGRVATGAIHNPHYFERMRTLGLSQLLPRGGGGGCETRWPNYATIRVHSAEKAVVGGYNTRDLIAFIYQSGVHVERVELVQLRAVTNRTNEDLRVDYLLNLIDEKRFKQTLQRRDRERTLALELIEPLETFVLLTMEFLLGAVDQPKIRASSIQALFAQYAELVNAPLVSIGQRYNHIVPQIILDVDMRKKGGWNGHHITLFESKGWRPPKASTRAGVGGEEIDLTDELAD